MLTPNSSHSLWHLWSWDYHFAYCSKIDSSSVLNGLRDVTVTELLVVTLQMSEGVAGLVSHLEVYPQ
jgi:hypothetical protein